MKSAALSIRAVREDELDLVLAFIRELAEYEHLAHQVTATGPDLRAALFGPRPLRIEAASSGNTFAKGCAFAISSAVNSGL